MPLLYASERGFTSQQFHAVQKQKRLNHFRHVRRLQYEPRISEEKQILGAGICGHIGGKPDQQRDRWLQERHRSRSTNRHAWSEAACTSFFSSSLRLPAWRFLSRPYAFAEHTSGLHGIEEPGRVQHLVDLVCRIAQTEGAAKAPVVENRVFKDVLHGCTLVKWFQGIAVAGVIQVADDGNMFDPFCQALVVQLPNSCCLSQPLCIAVGLGAKSLAWELVDHDQQVIAGGGGEVILRTVTTEDV